MRKNRIYAISLALLMVLGANAQGPKAFHKYCLVTSVTGGPSKALYTTRANDGALINSELLDGYIDPLITEYGLTDKIGLGMTRGGENFNVNVNKFYRQNILEGTNEHIMAASTKYITFDVSYHYLTTKRLDLSVFGSAGYYKLSGNAYAKYISGSDYQQTLFSYNARGGVIRTGARARYYYSKRWGVMAMAYAYTGGVRERNKPSPISDGRSNGGISTTLTGGGFEIGICMRLGKQNNVIAEIPKKKQRCLRRTTRDEDAEPLITILD